MSSPVSSTYDLFSDAFFGAPDAVFHRMRVEAPVHWEPTLEAWVLTRYEDVRAVLNDPRFSVDRNGRIRGATPPEAREKLADCYRLLSKWMIFTDEPDHSRLRTVIGPAYTPGAVRLVAPFVDQVVHELLSKAGVGAEFDVVADLAEPLTGLVNARLVGFPPELVGQVKQWSDDVFRLFGSGIVTEEIVDAAHVSLVECTEYAHKLIGDVEDATGDTLAGRLRASLDRGEVLDAEEAAKSVAMVMIGGHEAARHMIGNGLVALLREPSQLKLLRDRPELIDQAVDELVRYDSPSMASLRCARVDVEIGGTTIRAGQFVFAMLRAANHDPEVFDDPDHLDLARVGIQHLGFGFGRHFCSGASLTPLIVTSALRALIALEPQLTSDELQWIPSLSSRGPAALAVRFTRRPPTPELTGALVNDDDALDAAAHDQGNTVRIRPTSILRPGTVDDVVRMIRYCRGRNIQVAPRGTAHTSFGQCLVNGLAIDMRSLDRILEVGKDARTGTASIDVQGGALWQDVVDVGFAHGLRVRTGVPAVLRLTVGGVLSVGGISTSRVGGSIADSVEELEVVTGAGELLTCSPDRHRDLFEAVLGGLGQFGVIVRARLSMVPVAPLARGYALRYRHAELRQAFADQRILADRDGIDEQLLRWKWQPDGPTAELTAHVYYTSGNPPEDQYLMRGLSREPAAITELSYVDRAASIDRLYAEYERHGWADSLKLWSDNFVPDPGPGSSFEDVTLGILDEIGEREWSPSSTVLLFRKHRNAFRLPGLRLPDPALGRHLCMVAVSSDSFGKTVDAEYVRTRKATNRRWYELARDIGGTLYPLGATEFGPADWRCQYADYYDTFQQAKRRYDPDAIMTPTPAIFE
ncbi:cytochrome P450 [Nocardia vinacea]|uniref:cytochrome P450 n=1 Tax=Nocardia vinacea TaxID=96468 RepID=UPI0002E8B0B5|nr:cytochrome P450 [Nocardia vinacea]